VSKLLVNLRVESDPKISIVSKQNLTQLWPTPIKTRGVSHCGLAIYTKKYLKAKERIMEIQIFHHAKI
jgi:hypothetical protein